MSNRLASIVVVLSLSMIGACGPSRDEIAWRHANAVNSTASYESFIENFPRSDRVAQAREEIALLLQQQAEQEEKERRTFFEQRNTLIFDAARNNDVDTLNQLIAIGADVNSQDENGNTPLLIIATQATRSLSGYSKEENFGTAKILLDHGADMNIKNHEGESAWDVASMPIYRTSSFSNIDRVIRVELFSSPTPTGRDGEIKTVRNPLLYSLLENSR